MRSPPAAIEAAIQSSAFSLPTLVHVALANGDVLRFTNWDQPLQTDMANEGISPAPIYYPNMMEGLSAFSAQINGPIDDTELILIIDGTDILADDVRRGVYDNAVVTKGFVDPDELDEPWLFAKYDSSQCDIEGLKIKFELLGSEKRLEQPVGRVLTANCPYVFGDNDCGIPARANAWAATTVYALNAIVKRLTGTGIYWFKVTTAGTSAGSEPTWPTTNGGTVVDGTVTWTAFRARRLTGTVATVSNRTTFTATGVTVAVDYFGEGELTFLTGDNAGDRRTVKSDNGAGAIVLKTGAYDDITIGDTFEVVVGCRKRLSEDCVTKHDNAANSRTLTLRYGGFPFLAGENVTATAGKG